jgi:hypothetical protein
LVAQLSAINLMKAPLVDPNDNRSAEARTFNELCTEIIEVSGAITELFGSLIGILAEDAVSAVTTKQIPDGPKLSTFSLPYFFDEIDSLPAQPSNCRFKIFARARTAIARVTNRFYRWL